MPFLACAGGEVAVDEDEAAFAAFLKSSSRSMAASQVGNEADRYSEAMLAEDEIPVGLGPKGAS